MFNSEELKRLQQDVDGILEQITALNEALEIRHAEMIAKLDQAIETAEESRIDPANIENIQATVSDIEEKLDSKSDNTEED